MNILRPTTQPLLCPMLLLQKEIRFFCLLIKVLLGGERDVAAAVQRVALARIADFVDFKMRVLCSKISLLLDGPMAQVQEFFPRQPYNRANAALCSVASGSGAPQSRHTVLV